MWKNVFLFPVVLVLLSACEPRVNSRGNVIVAENIDSFITGKTTASDVIEKCGTPSLHKDNLTWIYIGAKSEEEAFRDVELKERFIVRLRFDQNKILKSVEKINPPESDAILIDEEINPLITEKQAENQVRIITGQGK